MTMSMSFDWFNSGDHKNILKSQAYESKQKIEKEICGVFDLVLIFGYNGCGLCSKFMGLIFG